MREFRSHGSVQGAPSNGRPYREQQVESWILSARIKNITKMVSTWRGWRHIRAYDRHSRCTLWLRIGFRMKEFLSALRVAGDRRLPFG